MIYLVATLIFSSVFLLLSGVYHLFFQNRIQMAERLARLNGKERIKARLREELQQPFWLRIGRPLQEKLIQIVARRMSNEKRLYFQLRLQAAGNPGGFGPGEFRLAQFLAACGGGILAAGGGWLAGVGASRVFLITLLGLICGWMLPEIFLNLRIKERRETVIRSLPDALDLLMVSVEAGLGFDLALVKVTERFTGVLAGEFRRVLQEMKLGKPRRNALKDMAERVGADDLTTFVGALTQADQMGVGIGNILRLQTEQLRRKRRQRAEEQAMKAPVKMLIPLVFFIFPALFVILLGPAVLQILKTL